MEDDTLTPEDWQVLKRTPKATPANRPYRYRMNHDAWQWILIAIGLVGLIVLEALR